MHVAIRQLVCTMLAMGVFLGPRMGSAQERAQVPACQQTQTGEKSAELARFEKDVAQLRGPQSAPTVPANPGMCLSAVSPATLLDGRVAAEGLTVLQTSFVVWLENRTSSYVTTHLYWRDVYSSYIHQTEAGVSPGQVVPHITSACGTVVAYILDAYVNGQYVGSTGATQPIETDGPPCSDAWVIQ
jgi:hypothetical protein